MGERVGKGKPMNVYEAENEEDLLDSMIQMLEQDTGKKIFTMKVLEHALEGLETLIVYEDKSVMMGMIKVGSIKGKLAIRMQGNYI
jgi:hypothetical protein